MSTSRQLDVLLMMNEPRPSLLFEHFSTFANRRVKTVEAGHEARYSRSLGSNVVILSIVTIVIISSV